jgi:hypothetical protein
MENYSKLSQSIKISLTNFILLFGNSTYRNECMGQNLSGHREDLYP